MSTRNVQSDYVVDVVWWGDRNSARVAEARLGTITSLNDDVNKMQAMSANVDCDTIDSIIKEVLVGVVGTFKIFKQGLAKRV